MDVNMVDKFLKAVEQVAQEEMQKPYPLPQQVMGREVIYTVAKNLRVDVAFLAKVIEKANNGE